MTRPLISISGGIALTRHEVERSTHLRTDEAWLAKAWDEPGSRVLVIEDGQALARIDDGAAELLFVPPEQAPEGTRFLLGVDADEVAYFGVGGPIQVPAEAVGAGLARAVLARAVLARAVLASVGRASARREPCSPTGTPGC